MVESILMGKDRARESHRESRRVTGETQRQREDICCGRDERPTPEKRVEPMKTRSFSREEAGSFSSWDWWGMKLYKQQQGSRIIKENTVHIVYIL
ncbi:hypothetical protein MTP99_019769 [Tenebrio molitor]|nr:hypothetical protein MTP99_019769 [Tenebrio molitor]